MNNKFRKISLIFLTMVFIMVNTKFYAAGASRAASVTNFGGNVTITKSGGDKTFNAYVGMPLEHGDNITTGKNSWVNINIDGDKELKVDEKTAIAFSELVYASNNGKKTGIKLFVGGLWSKIKNKLGKNDNYDIKTPTGSMGAKGTQFLVSYDTINSSDTGNTQNENSKAKLVVVEGVVEAVVTTPIHVSDDKGNTVEKQLTVAIKVEKNEQVELVLEKIQQEVQAIAEKVQQAETEKGNVELSNINDIIKEQVNQTKMQEMNVDRLDFKKLDSFTLENVIEEMKQNPESDKETITNLEKVYEQKAEEENIQEEIREEEIKLQQQNDLNNIKYDKNVETNKIEPIPQPPFLEEEPETIPIQTPTPTPVLTPTLTPPSYSYGPSSSSVSQTSKPSIDNIEVVNNGGANDYIVVKNLLVGDIVTVYYDELSECKMFSKQMEYAEDLYSNSVMLMQQGGTIYLTVKNSGKTESERLAVSYNAETCQNSNCIPVDAIQINNNPTGTSDILSCGSLNKGDIVKVYDQQVDGNLIGYGIVTSGNSVTLSCGQLGSTSGMVFVSLVEKNKSESVREPKSFEAEIGQVSDVFINNSHNNISKYYYVNSNDGFIEVDGLNPGDLLKIYKTPIGGEAINIKSCVSNAQTYITNSDGVASAIIPAEVLSLTPREIYISVITPNKLESVRIEVEFPGYGQNVFDGFIKNVSINGIEGAGFSQISAVHTKNWRFINPLPERTMFKSGQTKLLVTIQTKLALGTIITSKIELGDETEIYEDLGIIASAVTDEFGVAVLEFPLPTSFAGSSGTYVYYRLKDVMMTGQPIAINFNQIIYYIDNIMKAKNQAHLALMDQLKVYTQENYTQENWIILMTAKINGDKSIKSATDVTEVFNVMTAALNSMSAVEKITEVNAINPVIILTGVNPQIIEAGGTYNELGATAYDSCDVDITNNIVIDATTVNTALVGNYTVTYNVTDTNGNTAIQLTRTVIVADTTKPILTILGNPVETIQVCGSYTDAGATASDNYDGNITDSIATVNPVNVNVIGSYRVIYNVADANGNTAVQATRTVNVVDTKEPTVTVGYSITEPTNCDVIATINSTQPITIINNGGATTYTFEDNGSFTFEFVDAANNQGSVTAIVANIDKTAPTATVEYSTTEPTNCNVVASIISNEAITVTNNNEGTKYTFIDNGSFTFEFVDAAGNTGSVTATVQNIDKVAPTIKINAYPYEFTNGDVTVTLAYSGDSIVKQYSTDGITYNNYEQPILMTENGIIYTKAQDCAGNWSGVMSYVINTIDKVAPVIELTGSSIQIIKVGNAYSELGATTIDNYDGNISGSIVIDSTAVDTTVAGNYAVTYNVTDAAGNAGLQVTRAVIVIN